jgi:ABC-2 type transport system ATP-binding protein
VTALELLSVGKMRGKRPVLQDISLALARGESLALVGLNGAGKTTLLHCILNLASVDAGEVRLFGQPCAQVEARREAVFLPEQFRPPPQLSGNDFLRYFLALQGLRPPEDAASRLAGLALDATALEQPAGKLSKGMRQKLGLACALLSDKALTVLDEPASGLDPLARAQLHAALAAHRARGRGLLFTTHQLDGLDALTERIAVLHQGRLLFDGTPDALRARAGEPDLTRAWLDLTQNTEATGCIAENY